MRKLTRLRSAVIAALFICTLITPVMASADELHPANTVLNTRTGTIYNSLQSAIADAVADDTLDVAPGTYTETGQIVIDKNLTIIGASQATTIIKPAQDTGDSSSGDARGWFLSSPGITFNLSNVTLDGAGKLICHGLYLYSTGTIQNNTIKNIGCSQYYGRGIYLKADNTVRKNTLSNIGRIGIFLWQGTTMATLIDQNVYTGKGVGDFLDYGIELENGGKATITNNTITNNKGVAASDGSDSAAILATTYFGAGVTATITGNTLTGNTIGVAVGYDESDTSGVTIHNNDLSGNTFGVRTTSPEVNATSNWWGNPSGPTYSANPGGTGSGIEAINGGSVAYTPWYINPARSFLNTDVNTSTGSLEIGSGDLDLAVETPGQADLPTNVDVLTFSNGAGLNLNQNTTSTSVISVGGATQDTTITVGGQEVTVDKIVTLSSGTTDAITIKNSDAPQVTLQLPATVSIYAPSAWNGVVNPPTIVTPAATEVAPAGFTFSGSVLTVGSDTVTLVFNEAVTLLLEGVNTPVGYKSAGSNEWHLITTCGGDYNNPTLPVFPGECSVTNGTDTKILTFHFTSFAALTATPTPAKRVARKNVATNDAATENTSAAVAAVQAGSSSAVTEMADDNVAAVNKHGRFQWYYLLIAVSLLGVLYYVTESPIRKKLNK